MGTENLKIEYYDPRILKPYKNNTRHHEDMDINAIRESIRKFGFADPIGVWSDELLIVEGHGRQLAAIEEGMDKVPCIRLDWMTDEERRAYAIAHNRTAELSSWDTDLLQLELSTLKEIDLSSLNFEQLVDMNEEPTAEEDDYQGTVPEEAKAQVGDLYLLGDHRLICGDSTDPEVIKNLLGGHCVDMVLTDPPYGISVVKQSKVGGGGPTHFGKVGAGKVVPSKIYREVIGDDTTDTAEAAFNLLKEICDRIVLWGGNYFTKFLPFSDGWIIWDKRLNMASNNFADGEMAWCSFHTPVRIYHQLWSGMVREGEHEERVHPTQKPVRMLGEIIRDFTKEGQTVLDIFGGSGSTLIACEQMKRKCYMAELDPLYVDVIIDRWESLTGEKAVLVDR